jgi:hypothetical protein
MCRRGYLIRTMAATVLCGLSQGVVAEDPVTAAERAAQASAATSEGKKYEDEVATAFGRDQGKAVQACAREVRGPDVSEFSVLVRVSAVGEVEEVLVKPSTNVAACLQGKLKGWKVGRPPQADSWVRLQVRLKGKWSRVWRMEPQNKGMKLTSVEHM